MKALSLSRLVAASVNPVTWKMCWIDLYKFLIKKTCKGLDDPTTLHTLYCSLVHLNLEYCSMAMFPSKKRNLDKLERVQRRATKLIWKSDNTHDIRLKKLNFMS